MTKIRKLVDKRSDPANPEWTRADLAKARPASEVPALTGAKATDDPLRRGKGRPSKEDRKVNQTIRNG